MKIAMWSGPRNLSTAMMYAFSQRSDCAVVDEPFYAAYLHATGLDHPMRAEILAAQPTDPAEVVSKITGSNPEDLPHFYQKHMTQHMVPEIPRDWLAGVTNVFLIRHPVRVVASYAAKRENPSLEDIGFQQQVELFDAVRDLGHEPVVIDSADIRDDPEGMLMALCERLGLAFDPVMLSWPAGGHDCDGVWAPHWYGAVHRSTGFAGPEGPLPQLEGGAAKLVTQALPFYEKLYPFRLQPPT